MKCLLKYQWVKLPRNQMPTGKGIMGAWARLASRAAFRNGQARYCKICQSGHHRLLGRRYRRAQEHFGHQEPEQGPGDDGQAGPTGLHRL